MTSLADKGRKPTIFYGWFILVAAFLIGTIGYSMRYSFSVFYPEILGEFGWTRAGTVIAFSISMLVYGISSPIVGTLTDKFGPRKILLFGAFLLAAGLLAMSQMNSLWLFYCLFGVVIAAGVNAVGLAVHNAYLPNWFVSKRGFIYGLLVASVGLGNILVGIYQHIISGLGWRLAYVVLAVLVVVVILPLVIFVIRRTPQEKGLLPDGEVVMEDGKGLGTRGHVRVNLMVVDRYWAAQEWTLVKALGTLRFWLMFVMHIFVSFSFNLVQAHQPIYCQDIGFSADFAALIFGFAGFTLIIGNLSGFLSDRMGRETVFTLGLGGAIVAVYALMMATGSQPWLLYIYAIFWGTMFGMVGPTGFSALADLFSGEHFGAINGFFLLGAGIGGFIGPWLGGYIFDVTHSYKIAWILVIIALGLSGVFIWLAAPRKVRLVPGKVVG